MAGLVLTVLFSISSHVFINDIAQLQIFFQLLKPLSFSALVISYIQIGLILAGVLKVLLSALPKVVAVKSKRKEA